MILKISDQGLAIIQMLPGKHDSLRDIIVRDIKFPNNPISNP